MRQVGYLAAAGTYAINHQLKDLKEDHRKAKELEGVLQMRNYVQNVEPVTTNILIFSLIEGVSETKFIKDLNKRGIDIISLGKAKLRIVTHRDYTQDHHDYVLTTLIKMNEYA
jgi:threonine aldolase